MSAEPVPEDGMGEEDGTFSNEGRDPRLLENIFSLLRTQTGNDFSLYKKSTLYRRIIRRMGLHQIDGMADYVAFLRQNPQEIELLFKELLIGVTRFFRDPEVWMLLKDVVLTKLIKEQTEDCALRAWVPGCSTGEEAYSLAMAFKEAMEVVKPEHPIRLQIFATDLDRDAIDKARRGLFHETIAADVTPERLKRFFIQDERGYYISKAVRDMVVFAPQNVIMDPPFTKLDILVCRNLLIYLSSSLQHKLMPLFHYSLKRGGTLVLGTAEVVGPFFSLFSAIDNKARLYQRLEQPTAHTVVNFPAPTLNNTGTYGDADRPPSVKTPRPSMQNVVERLLIENFSPTGVLCTDKGDILYISRRAGNYLEPSVGRANLNIFSMAREGLRHDLSAAFHAALHEKQTIHVNGIRMGQNGGTIIELTVQQLSDPPEMRGAVLVVFADATPTRPTTKRGARSPAQDLRVDVLEQEMQRARDDLQTTREEMQTSQEELRSTNEELQSTNEELQSTNEELTTSKEEMQSLNEELQTVNYELQGKVDELSRANNDMKNLLNSTDIATLFLDTSLNVRRFTTATTKIFKLLPGDAGRPITDLTSELDYTNLANDSREVLRTLVAKTAQVNTHDHRRYVLRIMPYRTSENVIDGVVITFTDASISRELEAVAREQANQLKQIAESLPIMVWGCGPDGSCNYLSQQWVEYTGVSEKEHLGYGWLDQLSPEDREQVRRAWFAAIKAGQPFDATCRVRNRLGAFRWFKSHCVPIRSGEGTIVKWYGTHTDVDDIKNCVDTIAAPEKP